MASFSTLTDTFDTIDTAKWTNWGSLTATGGKATITNGISDTNYHGIDSKTTYDLTGTAVKIEIVDAGNQALTSLEVYPFQLTLDANNQLFWGIYNGTLQATKRVAGVNTSLYSTTYSNTTHRWVRIREASGTIYFDTSTDGTTWTNRASVANPFAITSLSLSILAGTWQNEASATTIQLDNLNTSGGSTTSLVWKGYTWTKRLTTQTWGPGFGGWSEENAWIDENGYLIMRLSNPTGNAPIGAEITNQTAGLGYGTYTITVDKDFTGIHKNLVFGGLFPLFYGNPYIEFDVNEVSKWEGATTKIGHNAWYGTDPDAPIVQGVEIDILSDSLQTHRLIWQPGKATFDSYIGADTSGTPYFHTVYTENIPVPSTEKCVINIWAFASGGTTTSDDTNIPETLVTVRDFTYTTDIPEETSSVEIDKPLGYAISTPTVIEKSQGYAVTATSVIDKSLGYTISASTALEKTLAYELVNYRPVTTLVTPLDGATASSLPSLVFTVNDPENESVITNVQITDDLSNFTPKVGLWVWDIASTVLGNTNEENILLNECIDTGITDLYLYTYATTLSASQSLYQSFISRCSQLNIRAWGLDGAREYFADADGRTDLLSNINAVIAYNTASASEARFYGFHMDCEPPDSGGYTAFHNGIAQSALSTVSGSGVWKDTQALDREYLMRDWVDMHKEIEELCHTNGLQFMTAITTFLDNYTGEPITCTYDGVTKNVFNHIADYSDAIALMSYNTNPVNVLNRVAYEFQQNTAPAIGFSMETATGVGANVSYGDTTGKQTKAALMADRDIIDGQLSGNPRYRYFNIHDWQGYKALSPASSDTSNPLP